MIKELGVAYHGNIYLDHARSDFQEMQNYGCNSVLLAMSEYDFEQWRSHYFKLAEIAKEEFCFSVYINLYLITFSFFTTQFFARFSPSYRISAEIH